MAKDSQAENPESQVEDKAAVDAAAEQSTVESPAEGAGDVVELARRLSETEAKLKDQIDQVMRARADMDNLRKRHERDLENAHKFALESFVQELLGVRDSLELGLSAAQDGTGDLAKLMEGTELTLKLLSNVMEKFGVKQVDPQGQGFNPDLHQAMSIQPREDVAPNTVVAVIQKGYTLNDRLVRPAMVMVSQAAGGGVDERA